MYNITTKMKYILVNSKRWKTKILMEKKGNMWQARCCGNPKVSATGASYAELVTNLKKNLL